MRNIILYGEPFSTEDFVQQCGRIRNEGCCYLLEIGKSGTDLLKGRRSESAKARLAASSAAVTRIFQGEECINTVLADYFSCESTVGCNCSFCTMPSEEVVAQVRDAAASSSASQASLANPVSKPRYTAAAADIDGTSELAGRSVSKDFIAEGGSLNHGLIVGRRGEWWTVRWDRIKLIDLAVFANRIPTTQVRRW